MKHAATLLFIFCLAQMSRAHEEISVEQKINQPIDKLEIQSGWNVHLIHCETDSAFNIAIVTDESYEHAATETPLCNLSPTTLTILENKTLPTGTVVEMKGNMKFKEIKIGERSVVKANRINTSCLIACKDDFIKIEQGARLHVGSLNIIGGPSIRVMDKGIFTVDTLMGAGNANIFLFGGTFEYSTNMTQGEITVSEFQRPESTPFTHRQTKKIVNDTVNGVIVVKESVKKWNGAISLGLSAGFRLDQGPKDFSSPFQNNGVFSLALPLYTSFRLSPHWKIDAGLQYSFNYRFMAHQLVLNEEGLKIIDGQTPIQQNTMTNSYIGIPVTLSRNIGKLDGENIAVDLFFGHTLSGRLWTLSPYNNHEGSHSDKVNHLLNPWKIEIGISLNTNALGIIHGVRIFTNLLPEFKKEYAKEHFKTIGFEFKL